MQKEEKIKVILSGSRAIKYHFLDFPREPKDWDFIVPVWNLKSSKQRTEYKCIPPILNHVKGNILTPDELLTLKASHIFWDINWDKHIFDINFLVKKGAKIIESLFYELYEFWNKVHGKNKRSKLDMSKEEFFDNKLNYIIDHDYIHTLLNPSPTYLKVLKDGADVDVDIEKFYKLSSKEKEDLVREEVYVMAWERGKKTRNYKASYNWMFKKFLMNHAPLWEAIFIIMNFEKLSTPEYDYFTKIESAMKLV